MVKTYSNIFTELDIDFILNLPEVKKAKEDIDIKSEGSIYFTINVSLEIQKILFDNLGLNLSNLPMRWIKGDTKPHVDHGQSTFNNTYLVYLTDSKGEFIVDNNSYSITKGCGYVFSEGLEHETVNTGLEPRLLLGPMSEEGFAVGAATIITANGATDTIYFYYTSETGFYYKINNFVYLSVSFPVTIVNSNTSSTLLTLFDSDIQISSNIFYFIAGSDNIQFGSTYLKNNGTRPVITIDGVTDYPGLIKNGDNFGNGFSNIYIYNLQITTANDSTLISNAGWIGQEYFAKGANSCYIVNCNSDGPIIDAGGGIVGGYAASYNGNLKIIGCSSSGNSGTYSGGIVGYYAGQNGGIVRCEMCWSTGIIGQYSGGIFGYSSGYISGETIAKNCYSTGLIGIYGGGIFGRVPGPQGLANAINCYSQGIISENAGGIFGAAAASDEGSTLAQNCYSYGTVTTFGNGIYGTNPQTGFSQTNCYSANGEWSNSAANAVLDGVPNPVIGIFWIYTGINNPYELNEMGYTPYTSENIVFEGVGGTPVLKQSFTQTINPGQQTIQAIRLGSSSHDIIQKSGGDPSSYGTITINDYTGAISTTSSTVSGTYTIKIRNTGSYNITIFELIVSGSSPQIQTNNNSFRVSNLFLDDLENSILLAQSGNGGVVNDSFNIYDILLLELVNEALINQ